MTQIDPDIEAMNQESSANATAELGGQAPPAEEPLDPGAVMSLFDAVASLMANWSDGAMEVPPMAPLDGQVEALPPEVFAPMVAVATVIGQAPEAGVDLALVDPFQATTNASVADLTGAYMDLAKDTQAAEAVKAALQSPAEETEEEDNSPESLLP